MMMMNIVENREKGRYLIKKVIDIFMGVIYKSTSIPTKR